MAMANRIIEQNVNVWIIAKWEEGYIFSNTCDIVKSLSSGYDDVFVAETRGYYPNYYKLGTLAFRSKSEALAADESARLSKIQGMEREIARLKSLKFED